MTRPIRFAIALTSLAIPAFLLWLIYLQEGSFQSKAATEIFPALNAILNALTAILLVCGYVFVKKGHIKLHILSMLTATLTSAAFLASYVVYHYYHGDTPFMGLGAIRYLYFATLISHIGCSLIQVPLIFTTLYWAGKKDYLKHKKIARWTLPIWLYVSITGVGIYFLLKDFGQ